jgi:hypothetical protein
MLIDVPQSKNAVPELSGAFMFYPQFVQTFISPIFAIL